MREFTLCYSARKIKKINIDASPNYNIHHKHKITISVKTLDKGEIGNGSNHWCKNILNDGNNGTRMNIIFCEKHDDTMKSPIPSAKMHAHAVEMSFEIYGMLFFSSSLCLFFCSCSRFVFLGKVFVLICVYVRGQCMHAYM